MFPTLSYETAPWWGAIVLGFCVGSYFFLKGVGKWVSERMTTLAKKQDEREDRIYSESAQNRQMFQDMMQNMVKEAMARAERAEKKVDDCEAKHEKSHATQIENATKMGFLEGEIKTMKQFYTPPPFDTSARQ